MEIAHVSKNYTYSIRDLSSYESGTIPNTGTHLEKRLMRSTKILVRIVGNSSQNWNR